MNKRYLIIMAVWALLCCVNLHAENIDPYQDGSQYAWGENVGWLNFELNTGDGAGVHVTNSDNRIEANNVTNNDRGIDVDSSGNIIIKNSASGLNKYDIVAGNKVGPISTDPATETSPWANFEF